MKITKKEEGWLIQPETSTEQANLDWLIGQLAKPQASTQDISLANQLPRERHDHNKAVSGLQ